MVDPVPYRAFLAMKKDIEMTHEIKKLVDSGVTDYKQIAEIAGYSTGYVYNTLNGYMNMSPAIRLAFDRAMNFLIGDEGEEEQQESRSEAYFADAVAANMIALGAVLKQPQAITAETKIPQEVLAEFGLLSNHTIGSLAETVTILSKRLTDVNRQFAEFRYAVRKVANE